jgi:hypothetical protein
VIILLMVVVAALVGAAVFLAPRTHHGTGSLPQAAPAAAPTPVSLCASCAEDYNPLAPAGSDKTQHHEDVGFAIDANRNTAWTTETYFNGLQKAGVGIYVDAKPGVAARELVLDTKTPGYRVQIYGRVNAPNPAAWDPGPGGWVKVGAAASVRATQNISLSTAGTAYRYYLVWITSLGSHNQVAVNEIALYK